MIIALGDQIIIYKASLKDVTVIVINRCAFTLCPMSTCITANWLKVIIIIIIKKGRITLHCWPKLFRYIYILVVRFQFIVLLRQRCFVWSKNDHTHQAIFTTRHWSLQSLLLPELSAVQNLFYSSLRSLYIYIFSGCRYVSEETPWSQEKWLTCWFRGVLIPGANDQPHDQSISV